MKYCPYCGADLVEDGVSFCVECGKQLPAGKTQKEKPEDKPEIKKINVSTNFSLALCFIKCYELKLHYFSLPLLSLNTCLLKLFTLPFPFSLGISNLLFRVLPFTEEPVAPVLKLLFMP